MKRVFLSACGIFLLSSAGLLTVQAAQPGRPARAEGLPAAVWGDWRVVEVKVDPKDSRRGLEHGYTLWDRQGRWFRFESNRITSNVIHQHQRQCADARVVTYKLTATELIDRSMATRASFDTLKPSDVGLPLFDSEVVKAHSVWCGQDAWRFMAGGSATELDWEWRPWFVIVNTDTIMLRWNDFSYLILKRRPLHEPIKASFSCEGISKASEQAICASVDLALYDKSLSEVYKFVRGYYEKADPKGQWREYLAPSQRKWLARRDACDSNTECLLDRMAERIMALIDDRAEFAYGLQQGYYPPPPAE